MRIPIILFLVLSISAAFGQKINMDKGATKKNPTLNRFVGKWQWCNQSDTPLFNLAIEDINIAEYNIEMIVGYHLYKKNGDITSSNMQNVAKSLKVKKSSVFGTKILDVTTLTGTFVDENKNKQLNLTLVLGPDGKGLNMTLKAKEGLFIGTVKEGTSLLSDVILSKTR